MSVSKDRHDVIVVGAGFTGLTVALELSRAGKKVLVLEADSTPGGLAGSFEFRDGVRIEKFYHHWFNNDEHVPELVHELGLDSEIVRNPSRTGMYFNGKQWRLSTPLDLLRFKPLSLMNRIRLGLLVFRVRRVKDWRAIEHLSIREWLEPLCGKEVFRIVWEPLIRSKFSIYAEKVGAVWFWKKLVLRGSTRNKRGGEELVYFKGGFGRLAEAMQVAIQENGGEIRYGETVKGLRVDGRTLHAVTTEHADLSANQFIFTPAFPVIADIFGPHVDASILAGWRRVNYLGNVCLVLELDRSLSETYWLNVNDPGFPFVGVIEHTNFDPAENYAGRHMVFLSRYLDTAEPLWTLADDDTLEYALGHLQRMFPKLQRSWIIDFRVWRAEFAQPITERNYSTYVPDTSTPFANAYISTMAHIYPEDRGTNYAIREGKAIARKLMMESESNG